MKGLTLGFLLLVCGGLARAQSPSSGSAGWVSIPLSAGLRSWTRVAIPPSRPLNPASQWRLDASHRAVICEGNRGHEWLRYDHPYKDFIFEVQWKLTKVRGAAHYNSGVFVRNNRDGSIWYQAQVGSTDGGYFFGDNPENGALHRFNLRGSIPKQHMKPPGRWNTYRIRATGRTLVLWVNGAKQSEFTQCNNPEGYIGLEAEGSEIEFRKLRVKTLPD